MFQNSSIVAQAFFLASARPRFAALNIDVASPGAVLSKKKRAGSADAIRANDWIKTATLAHATQQRYLPGGFAVGYPSASALTLFQRVAFGALLVFLVFAFSRINEFLPIPYAIRAPIAICLLGAFLSGGVFRAMLSRPGILLLLFTFWLCVSLPFSVWKGGSFALLTERWSTSLAVFLAISGALNTLAQCRKAMYAMAVASLLIMLMSFRFGGGERLSFVWGTLGNPNDFAAFLLLGTPFCVFVFVDQTRLPLKAAAVVGIAGIVVLTLRSGSRAGFATLLGMTAVMFWNLSLANKIKLAVIALIAAPLVVPFVPSSTWQRLTTLGSAESDELIENPDLGKAAASYWARRKLALDALELTVRNPVLGVGPGQFAPAAAGMAASRGERALWRETHNTYLQVSSECGLPALALFLAILGYCFRSMSWLRREAHRSPTLRPAAAMAGSIYLAVSIYAFVGLFGSYAYTMLLPAYAAFAEAISRTAAPLLQSPSANPAARRSHEPAPNPAPAFWPRPLLRF